MNIQFYGKKIKAEENVKINELFKEEIQNSKWAVVGAKFNNKYVNLQYEIKKDGSVELIDISSKEGMKIYKRTLIYILGKALENVCPEGKLVVDYQLSNSLFCEVYGAEITKEFVQEVEKEMRNIIAQNLPIKQVIIDRKQAEKIYKKTNTPKGRLQFDIEDNQDIYMYYCEDYYNYIYGVLGDRTGITKLFRIIKYHNGLLLKYPGSNNPDKIAEITRTKKLEWALEEYEDIHRLLDINTVFKLNRAIETDKIQDVILLAEALHEKKIANMADNIAKNRDIKIILIAGPSSSGKTTFAQRLGIQLRLNGIKPVTISVDNYFVERLDTPKDEDGKYDFESIEAIDIKLFNKHLTALLKGKEIEMPEFDFLVGTKKYNGKKVKLEKDEVLVVEGIHCLNDKLTSSIEKNQKYKIYISALTVLNMDRYNRISTTDTRLIRRIVRDNQFRGYTAKHTIDGWDSVNRGENRNIFPFQEEADSIFNTSLIYELSALKPLVEPLLKEISRDEPEYAEAYRILDLLRYFKSIPSDYVPKNSLLKEFLGGGAFE